MKKKNLMSRGMGLMIMLPLSLAACDTATPSDRKPYEADEETPTPTKETEKPTEAEDTPAPEPDTEPQAGPDYDVIYASVLQENLDVIQNGYDYEKDYKYLSSGIMERVMYGDKDELLNSLGYAIVDLSGDGVPELLIGENAKFTDEDTADTSYVYAAFTCVKDKPEWVFEGWARSSNRYLGNGFFYHDGSGGAAHSYIGRFHLSADGTKQVWDEFYFTDDSSGELKYYSNNTGEGDPAASEELSIKGEEFYDLIDNSVMQKLAFMPISSFKGAVVNTGAGHNTAQISDEPIVGSWGLRSYVNMDIISYHIYDDGTWLAVENMPSYVLDGSFSANEHLSGTWKEGKGGSAGYYAYDLYDENGHLYKPVLVYDEDGEMVMNTGNNLVFYSGDLYIDSEIVGKWLSNRGSGVEFDDKGNWNYYDDEGSWLFGGHCVITNGPGYTYLRLHTQAGDSGNAVFAEGEFYMNNTGYNVIDMNYTPAFEDITGDEDSLSKGR